MLPSFLKDWLGEASMVEPLKKYDLINISTFVSRLQELVRVLFLKETYAFGCAPGRCRSVIYRKIEPCGVETPNL